MYFICISQVDDNRAVLFLEHYEVPRRLMNKEPTTPSSAAQHLVVCRAAVRSLSDIRTMYISEELGTHNMHAAPRVS